MSDRRYPIAPNGIFTTIQGEGALLGVPMVFVRLAGCSVGCPGCDTNYTVSRRIHYLDILEEVERLAHLHNTKWVWITGGEPTDHDITPIVKGCHYIELKVALATAGVRSVNWMGNDVQGYDAFCAVDFVSVSPHAMDSSWVQRKGDQVNIVPGLNGLSLKDVEGTDVKGFQHKYVTPYHNGTNWENLQECIDWVRCHEGWRLGIQAHKLWELP